MQAISIPVGLTGANWALARIVRRRAPWNVDHLRHPIGTFFDAVRTGAGVDVYIFDTGVRTSHDEFGGRATALTDGEDNHGHGTSVAALAVGGTVGVARQASLFAVRCLDGNQSNPESFIEAAVDEVLDHYAGRSNPAVANFATGADTDEIISPQVARLIDAGIVCIGTANNFMQQLGVDIDRYPAMSPDVVCVGGVGMADIPYYRDNAAGVLGGTNYGDPVDILAPSQDLWTAAFTGDSDHRLFNGTSGGAPLVAGVVACMLEGHAKLTGRSQVQAVVAQLIANATTGRLRSGFGLAPLPDRILYLDPDIAVEEIPGLGGESETEPATEPEPETEPPEPEPETEPEPEPITSLVPVASAAAVNSGALTVPDGVQEGDLLAYLGTGAAWGNPVPDGYLTVRSHNVQVELGITLLNVLCVRVADGSEGGQQFVPEVGGSNTSVRQILQVLRANRPIAGVEVGGGVSASSGGDPPARTIPSASAAAPVLALAGYRANAGDTVNPRTMTPAKDGELNVGNSSLWLARHFFGGDPEDVTIDMGDEGGANVILGGWARLI